MIMDSQKYIHLVNLFFVFMTDKLKPPMVRFVAHPQYLCAKQFRYCKNFMSKY